MIGRKSSVANTPHATNEINTLATESSSISRRGLGNKDSRLTLMEQTVEDLTKALTEAQAELRDETTRSEVLKTTVVAVSKALQIAEDGRKRAEVEAERLRLQLSALSYYEAPLKNDEESHADADVIEIDIGSPRKLDKEKRTTIGNDLGSKIKALETLRATRQKTGKGSPIDVDQVMDNQEMDDTVEVVQAVPNGGRSTNQDVAEEKKSDDEEMSERRLWGNTSPHDDSQGSDVKAEGSESENPGKSPGQAAFYRVLIERDVAKAQAERYRKKLASQDAAVQDLRNRLNKSVALVELSYNDEKSSKRKGLKDSKFVRSARRGGGQKKSEKESKAGWFNGKSDTKLTNSDEKKNMSLTTAVIDHADQAAGISNGNRPTKRKVEKAAKPERFQI